MDKLLQKQLNNKLITRLPDCDLEVIEQALKEQREEIVEMIEGKKWKFIENIDIDKKMKKALISMVNFTLQDIINSLKK